MLLSIRSIRAIIGLLKHYDGRPPTAGYHNISLNEIISLLATVSVLNQALGQLEWNWCRGITPGRKLVVLQKCDAASRGPYGASQRLFQH